MRMTRIFTFVCSLRECVGADAPLGPNPQSMNVAYGYAPRLRKGRRRAPR